MSQSPPLLLMSFARVLSAACAEQAITRDQLVSESGIPQEVLAAMEAGRHAPTLDELVVLAQVLGCEAADLIEWTMAGCQHDAGR